MSLCTLTVSEARDGLRRRQFTSTDLTRAFLARIAALNPRLHAYLSVNEDEAQQQAHDADERMAHGEDTAMLGVPIAIKDVLSTRGQRTTAGSRISPLTSTMASPL